MTTLLRIVLATLLLASCAQSVDFEFEAKSENLSAKATITEIEFNFKDGFTKLSGDVAIKNTSLQPQYYSNMWLRLQSGGKIQERAYLDNLTSHHVDSDVVEIPPGETLELPIYWVFPDSEIGQLGNDAFVLEILSDDEQ